MRRKRIDYAGVGTVARWLGVKPAALAKAMQRHPDYPDPDATIAPGRAKDKPDEGWLPGRRPEWEAWQASLPGRGTGGGRPRKQAGGPESARLPPRSAMMTCSPSPSRCEPG